MALKLNERYPGRFSNPSADYPQGSFKNRTTPTSKDGSYLEKDWANDKEGFFQSLLSYAGITANGSVDKVGASQYFDALMAAIRKTTILTDTGAANVYAAANTPALTALPSTGYMQRVNIANANTGPATYAPDGLVARPIYGLALQPLQGGELPAGVAVLMYLVQAGVNSGNGAWIIIESLGGAAQLVGATRSLHAVNAGQIQAQSLTAFTTAGTAPAFTLTPTPAITAYVTGQRFQVSFHASGGATPTLNVSGQGAKSLKQYDSTATKISAFVVNGQIADVVYDGTDFIVLDQLPSTGAPPGTVISFASSTPPAGYLKANGASVSRTTYASLFAAIGTTFGAGDGSTTFNLPELRGEVIRNWDDGRGIDVGRAFGSLQLDAMQGHSHAMYYSAAATIGSGGNSYIQQVASGNNAGPVNDTVRAPITDSTNGTPRISTETRARNVALLACIKY
ncbi:phage tail protein [Pseudomonas asplenii]|uniref:phage tail protein n=1 Tax=Pseudomonas asplenii TaxID=53407 RepID=UPI0003723DFD|nr:phage tail protein [Pseudomonas fuscovaginae]